MRMAFGIVSLLVTMAIILYLMVGGGGTGGPGYLQQVASANKQLKSEVNVLGGYDAGRQVLATDSIKYRIDRTTGRPKLLITEVMANGPMESRFGLRVKDQIVEVGPLEVGSNISSFDDATAAIHDAYSRGGSITVLREGKKLTLPTAEHLAVIEERRKKAALAEATPAAPAPAPPTPAAPADDRTALQKALDTVRSTPGQ